MKKLFLMPLFLILLGLGKTSLAMGDACGVLIYVCGNVNDNEKELVANKFYNYFSGDDQLYPRDMLISNNSSVRLNGTLNYEMRQWGQPYQYKQDYGCMAVVAIEIQKNEGYYRMRVQHIFFRNNECIGTVTAERKANSLGDLSKLCEEAIQRYDNMP